MNESIVIIDNKIVSLLKNQEKLDSIIQHLDDSLEGKSDSLSLSQLSIELRRIKMRKQTQKMNEELENNTNLSSCEKNCLRYLRLECLIIQKIMNCTLD